jgi:hypothetical protein
MNGFVGLEIAKLGGGGAGETAYLKEIKSEQFVSLAVVQAAILTAMNTSISPEHVPHYAYKKLIKSKIIILQKIKIV